MDKRKESPQSSLNVSNLYFSSCLVYSKAMSVVLSDFDGTWENIENLWGDVDAIVTGRSFQEFQDFRDEYIGPEKPVFFNPVTTSENTLNKIVNHKAEMINRMKATRFYEDMPNEAAMLKILCINCKIILVKKGVTSL